jgi:hypothetical protein
MISGDISNSALFARATLARATAALPTLARATAVLAALARAKLLGRLWLGLLTDIVQLSNNKVLQVTTRTTVKLWLNNTVHTSFDE